MDGVDRPTLAAVFTAWTVQPLALALALVLAAAYARGLRARRGTPWPLGRTLAFTAGVVLLVWASCGFLQVYAASLYWVWVTQTLILWLIVPIIVLWGHPLQLAGEPALRWLRTRPMRVLSNPLVGPALVPILSGVLFFGPLPGWAIASSAVGWVLQLVLLVVGALMVLPLVGLDEGASSLAVGLSLAIGSFELVMDALPGIVLRLHNSLATSYFDHRERHSWTPDALRDQRLAGAIVWCLAEVIDLPFLFLVFRRWLRADARDAATVDAVLEAERAARGGAEEDAPWWLSDPVMQERLRRRP